MHASQLIAQLPDPGEGWGAIPFFLAFVAALLVTFALKRWLNRGLPSPGNEGETDEAGADSDTSGSGPGSEAGSERHSVPKHGA